MNTQIKCCTDFNNEEIIKFLVNPLRRYSQLDIRLLSNDKELSDNDSEKIECVILDGDKQDFYVGFYGNSISLYTPYKSEEIIFFDDRLKTDFLHGSELYGTIFYEGKLSNKTNKEILELILQFIKIFIGSIKVEFDSSEIIEKEIVNFTIKVFNETGEKKEITIENITFILNGE